MATDTGIDDRTITPSMLHDMIERVARRGSPPQFFMVSSRAARQLLEMGFDVGFATVPNHEGRHGRQWHRLHPTGADRLDPDRLPAWMEWLD